MKAISLRKAIEIFGGTNIELKSGYHYSYGFFEKNNQLYYINSGDDRMRKSDGQLDVMYRTAQHRKDWTGGTNQWDFLRQLNNAGYKVMTCRVKS
jgi:hypothetical protein